MSDDESRSKCTGLSTLQREAGFNCTGLLGAECGATVAYFYLGNAVFYSSLVSHTNLNDNLQYIYDIIRPRQPPERRKEKKRSPSNRHDGARCRCKSTQKTIIGTPNPKTTRPEKQPPAARHRR